ncbi:MAG: hypothetical protein ABWZ40_02845 [Caulobacterales bacterium]
MGEAKGELIVLHDRRDRLEANRLVRKLESEGFRVARQDPGSPRRFKQDSPTVVLWSRNAAGRGLRSALDSDSAVIAKLDSRMAPSGAKVMDFRGWRGQDRHQGWKTLLEAVAPASTRQVIAATAPAPALPATAKPAKKTAASIAAPAEDVADEKSSIWPAVVGILAAASVFAAAAYLFL